MQPTPRTTSEPCTAHRYHRPEPTYREKHHVIPQAWQRFWQPPTRVANTPVAVITLREEPLETITLWDARTLVLCRTGHGNVHYWLERAMRTYYEILPDYATDPKTPIEDAWAVVIRNGQHEGRVTPSEVRIAKLAMERFTLAGGSLLGLCAAGLYGEI